MRLKKKKIKAPILVASDQQIKTVHEAIERLDLRTKKRGIWVLPESTIDPVKAGEEL